MKPQKQYSEKLVPFQGKLIDLECPEHGVNPFTWEKHGRRYRCRGCNTDAILRRKIRLKTTLVEERGGKCEECGYNRYIGALHFHHIDPTTKKIVIGQMTSKSEKLVREEVAKCALLCANCHAEKHAINKNINTDIKLKKNVYTKCEHCSKPFEYKTYKNTRCNACAGMFKNNNYIEWPSFENLKNMVEKSSYSAVGKELGVSDNAIRKRIQNKEKLLKRRQKYNHTTGN